MYLEVVIGLRREVFILDGDGECASNEARDAVRRISTHKALNVYDEDEELDYGDL